MRPAVRVAPILALALLATCKSGDTLQNAAESLIGDIDGLFGGDSAVVRQIAKIRDANTPSFTALRRDVDDPLETTRTAVRALATCDYPSWNEAALVVVLLSSMADEHESSLVRAESLDTLTRIAPWTFKGAVSPEHPSTVSEVFDAFPVLKAAVGRADPDPALLAQTTAAVLTMANHPFQHVEAQAPVGGDNRALSRPYHMNLRSARAALRSMTGRSLEGFLGDPGMHDALEIAYPSLSAAVIRLTLVKAALADSAEATRSAAVRDMAALAPNEGGPVLRRVLVYDGYSSVRREAAKALSAYPAMVAVPALIEGLSDEMADVRGAAASSLESVTGQTLGDDRGAWLRWWQANGAKALAAGAGK